MMPRQYFALGLLAYSLVGAASGRADKVDFATQIQPIFAQRCAGCHGEKKQMGKLRLDSAEEIGKFEEKTLLVAGKPDESELFQRITLPADDKKRMPKGGDPLSAEQIELIKQWITDGASFTSIDAPAPKDAPAEQPQATPPAPPAEEDPELAKLPKASAEAIAKIEATGATVMPLFADSPLLQVSFAQAASPPGDEAVAALTAAADQIVWLNLSKSQVTAVGLAPLAQLKNLIQLHLEHSNVDDAGLAHLAGLPRLEYVNVFGTSVTDAGAEHLKALPKLRRFYVWQTKISFEEAEALQKAIPGLEVNLGWDHPAVVKVRVTKELATAKEIVATATTRASELEQQFNAAKQGKEQAEARVKELEDQLKALEAPAPAEGAAPAEQAAAPAETTAPAEQAAK
jgi:mono/diheme cytochrome c family protein